MSENQALASPQSIIWEYYSCLNRRLVEIEQQEESRTQKQDLAVMLMLSVTIVEAFMNAFFRVVVGESEYKDHESRFLKDIDSRISLERKIKEWPKKILGRRLDFSKGGVREFMQLKDHRNLLMHFVASYETIELPGPVIINGLSNMEAYEALAIEKANQYPAIIRGFAYEIFTCRGIGSDNHPHAFHRWFGEPPPNKSGFGTA